MNVLVDTSIWSQALRKNTPQNNIIEAELSELIKELRVRIIGPVRQEILSGIKTDAQYEKIRHHLSAFPDIPLESGDYEKAAAFFNACRKNGVQGSNTDFLICAAAYRHNLEIFTTDNDFSGFQKIIPINLYSIRKPR